MIKFRRLTIANMKKDANNAAPNEMCGLIVAWISDRYEANKFVFYVPAKNVADDPMTRYVVDPDTHLAFARSMTFEIVGVVHSHARSESVPSQIDADGMRVGLWYPIIDARTGEMRVWRKERVDNPIGYNADQESILVDREHVVISSSFEVEPYQAPV